MSKNTKKWDFEKPIDFTDQVKNLPKPLRKKIGSIMNALALSQYPNRLGKKKLSKFGECFTIDIDKSYRLSYVLDFNNHKIKIYGIGDHKQTYGHD